MVKTVLLLIIMVMTKDRERVLWGRLTLEQGIGSGGLGVDGTTELLRGGGTSLFLNGSRPHPRHPWQFLGLSIIEDIMCCFYALGLA